MTKRFTKSEMEETVSTPPGVTEKINTWLARGDGVAVYENMAMDSTTFGARVFLSFGSLEAQLDVEHPPDRMPDIPEPFGWKYCLQGTYRGEALGFPLGEKE